MGEILGDAGVQIKNPAGAGILPTGCQLNDRIGGVNGRRTEGEEKGK
jgi:hypothetical protein